MEQKEVIATIKINSDYRIEDTINLEEVIQTTMDDLTHSRNVLIDLKNRLVGGMIFSDDSLDEIDILYPEDKQEIIYNTLTNLTPILFKILELKTETNISGAMNWPNSKEARVDYFTEDFLKLVRLV
jgi:hypothetical protein